MREVRVHIYRDQGFFGYLCSQRKALSLKGGSLNDCQLPGRNTVLKKIAGEGN